MISNMQLTIFLLIFVYAVVRILFRKTIYAYWQKRNVPFPEPICFFGNMLNVILLRKTVAELVLDLYKTYSEHPYVGFYNMCKPALVIRDPRMIKDILIKDFEHFQENWFTVDRKVDLCIACNPFVLKSKEWKDTRTMVASQFTGAKVKVVFPLMQSGCTKMLDYIENFRQSNRLVCLEVTNICTRFTGENVMSCGFGLDAQSFLLENPDTFKVLTASCNPLGIIDAVKRTYGILSTFMDKILNTTFMGDPTSKIFYEIITNAVNNRIKNNIIRNDYLNYLIDLRNKGKFASEDLVGHAFTLFIDGFHTSGAAMSYALLELTLNPEIQEKARKEVVQVLKRHQNQMSYESCQELQYIENIVYETLRKRSIIKIAGRKCTKQYDLKDASEKTCLTIEKGTNVFVSITAMHYDPQYYPEPDKFDPDRFKEETRQSRPKCSFLGFGEGPKMCLGRRFAVTQIVAGLAAILANFDLKLNAKTEFPIVKSYCHLFDTPHSGIFIDFERRPITK